METIPIPISSDDSDDEIVFKAVDEKSNNNSDVVYCYTILNAKKTHKSNKEIKASASVSTLTSNIVDQKSKIPTIVVDDEENISQSNKKMYTINLIDDDESGITNDKKTDLNVTAGQNITTSSRNFFVPINSQKVDIVMKSDSTKNMSLSITDTPLTKNVQVVFEGRSNPVTVSEQVTPEEEVCSIEKRLALSTGTKYCKRVDLVPLSNNCFYKSASNENKNVHDILPTKLENPQASSEKKFFSEINGDNSNDCTSLGDRKGFRGDRSSSSTKRLLDSEPKRKRFSYQSNSSEEDKATDGEDSRPTCSKEDPASSNIAEVETDQPTCRSHSLFLKVLSICKNLGRRDVMKKAQAKLETYFELSDSDFLNSDEFYDLLESSLQKLKRKKKSSQNVYSVLRKILDQLKSNVPKTAIRIIRLQKLLKNLNKKIRKLEEAEVTSDEEYEDNYVLLDRYQKKAVQVHKSLCELQNKPSDAERVALRNVTFVADLPLALEGDQRYEILLNAIGRQLEKYYNRHRKFPSFPDVHKTAKKLNTKEHLKVSDNKLFFIAKHAFTEFGKMLKRIRCHDDYTISYEYLNTDSEDPAVNDSELQSKLRENIKLRKREEEVLDAFVLKQMNQNSTSSEEKSSVSDESGSSSSEAENSSEEDK